MNVLAKFHVVVHKIGRIIILAGTRKFYGIGPGDFVEVKINNKKAREGVLITRVGEQGAVVIPKALREVMDIKPKAKIRRAGAAGIYLSPKKNLSVASGKRNITLNTGSVKRKIHLVRI